MKRKAMDILCCTVCRGELGLKAEEERDGEIETGELTCTSCGIRYPVKEGIPMMKVPSQR